MQRPLSLLFAAIASSSLPAQLPSKPALDLAAARAIADGAHTAAAAARATVVIAVVDDGGHLILLERRDDTQVASVDVAIAKARTAAIFRRPTREFEQQIKNGRLATLVLPGAAPLQGGVPIVLGTQCLGAIGVSGNSPAQDEQVALAGAAVAARFGCLRSGQAPPVAIVPEAVAATIERLHPDFDAVLAPDAAVERVASGFTFTEGPLWVGDALWFSDPNENLIWSWSAARGLSPVRLQSGYQGADIARYRQPGSNGLALDAQGRLLVCEHGNRCLSRIETDGRRSVLVDNFDGKRLNSPNDLAVGRDGSVWFTDPVFGLPGFERDPAREIPFAGVYRWRQGEVQLVTKDLRGPNGIALSPREDALYVGDWDVQHKAVVRYPLAGDGSVGPGATFLDLTSEPGSTAIDGIEVDDAGNVYVCGPRGVWIVAPDGKRLGRIGADVAEPHNLAFGDDGRTLYLAAQAGIYRVRTRVGKTAER